MNTQLTVIDPIHPPDVRRPVNLTKLPLWVQQRCDILKKATQPNREGVHREVPVLPANLILDNEQKQLVENHAAALAVILAMTPATEIAHGELTLSTVSKMIMVLPSRESGDLANEAKGEAFMSALEDVPSWAVQEAMRKWHRSEYGPKYDYKWQPAPATLRELAMMETYRVMGVRRQLNNLLLAEPVLEFTPEQEARMRARVADHLKIGKV